MTGLLIASFMMCVCVCVCVCVVVVFYAKRLVGRQRKKKKNFKDSLCIGRHCGGGLN